MDTIVVEGEPVGDATAVTTGGKRIKRRYSLEQKQRIVAETRVPGSSVSQVARRHDINSNVVFTWRKQMREGGLCATPALIPVHLKESAMPTERAAHGREEKVSSEAATIDIELADGHRIQVQGAVDARLLCQVLETLTR